MLFNRIAILLFLSHYLVECEFHCTAGVDLSYLGLGWLVDPEEKGMACDLFFHVIKEVIIEEQELQVVLGIVKQKLKHILGLIVVQASHRHLVRDVLISVFLICEGMLPKVILRGLRLIHLEIIIQNVIIFTLLLL